MDGRIIHITHPGTLHTILIMGMVTIGMATGTVTGMDITVIAMIVIPDITITGHVQHDLVLTIPIPAKTIITRLLLKNIKMLTREKMPEGM